MKIHAGPFIIDEALGCRAREVFDSALGLEGAIAFLRLTGEGKPGSLRVLVKACGVSLGDAKRALELSPTWQDRRAIDAALRHAATLGFASVGSEQDERKQELQKAS